MMEYQNLKKIIFILLNIMFLCNTVFNIHYFINSGFGGKFLNNE